MRTATHSVHIDADPEAVFNRVVDPAIVPPGITVAMVYESAHTVGSVYEWTYRLAGLPFRGITVCTEYVRNRRFTSKYLGFVGATVAFTLEPEAGGTKLTREMDFTIHVPVLGRLLEALMVKASEPDAVRTAACPTLVEYFIRRGAERQSGQDRGACSRRSESARTSGWTPAISEIAGPSPLEGKAATSQPEKEIRTEG